MYALRTEEDAARLVAHIERAIRLAQPLTLTYVKETGEVTVRTVEPWTVAENATGDFFMKTMDRETGAVRSFRLDRVLLWSTHRGIRTIDNKYLEVQNGATHA